MFRGSIGAEPVRSKLVFEEDLESNYGRSITGSNSESEEEDSDSSSASGSRGVSLGFGQYASQFIKEDERRPFFLHIRADIERLNSLLNTIIFIPERRFSGVTYLDITAEVVGASPGVGRRKALRPIHVEEKMKSIGLSTDSDLDALSSACSLELLQGIKPAFSQFEIKDGSSQRKYTLYASLESNFGLFADDPISVRTVATASQAQYNITNNKTRDEFDMSNLDEFTPRKGVTPGLIKDPSFLGQERDCGPVTVEIGLDGYPSARKNIFTGGVRTPRPASPWGFQGTANPEYTIGDHEIDFDGTTGRRPVQVTFAHEGPAGDKYIPTVGILDKVPLLFFFEKSLKRPKKLFANYLNKNGFFMYKNTLN